MESPKWGICWEPLVAQKGFRRVRGMGFLILILIAFVIWFYLKNKNLQKQEKTAQRTALQLQEEKIRERRAAESASAARNNFKEDITVETLDNSESSSAEQPRQHRNTSIQKIVIL